MTRPASVALVVLVACTTRAPSDSQNISGYDSGLGRSRAPYDQDQDATGDADEAGDPMDDVQYIMDGEPCPLPGDSYDGGSTCQWQCEQQVPGDGDCPADDPDAAPYVVLWCNLPCVDVPNLCGAKLCHQGCWCP